MNTTKFHFHLTISKYMVHIKMNTTKFHFHLTISKYMVHINTTKFNLNLAPRRVLKNKHFTEVKYREIILWAYCILVELVGGTARGATKNKGRPIRSVPRRHTSLNRTDGRTDGLWTKVPAKK